jgi:hypothetical protein
MCILNILSAYQWHIVIIVFLTVGNAIGEGANGNRLVVPIWARRGSILIG